MSWGGKFFGGFVKPYKSALEQSKLIQGVKFICFDYANYLYDKNSIIYCDPPYYNTTRYKIKFDYGKFYNWCINMAKLGYILYVSEYNVNEKYKNYFKIVWQKEIKQQLSKTKRVEKLFKIIV